ncbi:hypothetical protein E2C01_015256 [Portunus trituberculatus]|uniref:Uncharacterized protein n=1 Tax=Portunus trituberculatus TaxID=210409 RepID=A0A5B7DMN9_PORTR|nr:hypothetical protein [Portunus trituberculatus]
MTSDKDAMVEDRRCGWRPSHAVVVTWCLAVAATVVAGGRLFLQPPSSLPPPLAVSSPRLPHHHHHYYSILNTRVSPLMTQCAAVTTAAISNAPVIT